MPDITFTFDFEDTRTSWQQNARHDRITSTLLDVLNELGIRGTFFVVGELARDSAAVVKRISEEGHEIGLHGWRHVPLDRLTPVELRDDLVRGRDSLELLTGQPIVGYRAPMFALTPATAWAVDVIGDCGFDYSSSILPNRNPLHGYPGAPKEPFLWDNGLMEFPVPIAPMFGYHMPFLGGVYLRYLPMAKIQSCVEQYGGTDLWLYSHPYDFDVGEPYHRLPWASHLVSLILHFRRGVTYPRVRSIFGRFPAGPPLADIARKHRQNDDAMIRFSR